MIALIDADILIFQASFRNEETFAWDEETVSSTADLEAGKEDIRNKIASILEATKASDFLMCMTSPKNFRYQVLPTYKGNRRDKQKPSLLPDLWKFVEETYETKKKPQLEADDVMGILMTLHPSKYICCSIDKDLLQIPGRHYNFGTDTHSVVTEEQGDFLFYKQTLTGDVTDNYKGCPGVGPKKAEAILTPQEGSTYYPGWQWERIVETYLSKGLTEADALQQARVARILRKSDYNFKTKEPILWTPPR